MDVSVVIAAYNEAECLPGQLDALLAQEWDGSWEIIVADNGSTDATPELVEAYAAADDRVRLVDASTVSGAPHARNVAMTAARGDAFVFCDADDLVEPGWLAAMGDGLRTADAVTGPLAVDRLNPTWVQTAYYRTPPQTLTQFHDVFPFAATANLGVRRAVVERVGDFDETIPPGEDMEFCLRMWERDVELQYVREAVVQYRYRPSLRALWRRTCEYAAVAPAIAKRLDANGHPAPAALGGARQWLWLLRHVPTLRTQAGRARWIVVSATKVGRLIGSVQQRRLLL